MTEIEFTKKIGTKTLVFQRPILQVIEFCGNHIVRLATAGNVYNSQYDIPVKPDNNVLCFDDSGNLIWEIASVPKFNSRGGPYGPLFIENNKLIVFHQMGLDFEINILDGSVKCITEGRAW